MTPTNTEEFKGNTGQILRSTVLYVLLFGFIASFGLLGRNWAYLFITSLFAGLPVVVLVTLLMGWLNRFSFDDEVGAFRKPGKRFISYQQVKGIVLSESVTTLDVYVKQGWMHTTALVLALDRGRKEQLMAELGKRFPDVTVRRKPWSSTLAVWSVLAAMILVIAGAHWFLYHHYPQLKVLSRNMDWTAGKNIRHSVPQETLENFEFVLPPGFKYAGEQGSQLYFEDRVEKIRIKAVSRIQRPELERKALFFRYGMGVVDYFDLLSLAYESRVGVIPLFLKGLETQGLENVVIYKVGPPFLRGFVTQGKRGKEEASHIVLVGNRPGEEIHFFLTGSRRVPEDLLRNIVTSVRLVRQPEA
jgi:hypothetical protein